MISSEHPTLSLSFVDSLGQLSAVTLTSGKTQNTFCPEGEVYKHGFFTKSPPLQLFGSQNSWKRRFFILSKSSKGNYILKYLKGQNIKGSIAVDQIINIEVGISNSEIMETVRKMFKCLPEQVMSISTGNRYVEMQYDIIVIQTCSWISAEVQVECAKPARVQGVSGQHCQSHDLILGSPPRSREMDSMILIGPFQLDIFYDSVVSDVFSHSQVTDETQLQNLDIFIPLADINSYLKLTEAAGQICISQWTGPCRLGCLFNHGDHIVAVNDLQPQNVEEAYFFISRSTRKEVSLTNMKVIGKRIKPNEKASCFLHLKWLHSNQFTLF
uniref:Pleckstrin homology domain containing S1 n=1 Tax=Aquila chrysaetos chrysaetos TaxID=223781 RepID=A0A663E9Q2_AQUCH